MKRIAERTGNTRRGHWKRQVNTEGYAGGIGLGTNGATVEQTEGNVRGNPPGIYGKRWGLYVHITERMGTYG